MKIPNDTSFLFACGLHDVTLTLAHELEPPRMMHPSIHATAVWVFDFSAMRCEAEAPEYQTEKYSREHLGYQGRTGTECMVHWEVRA